MPAKDKKAYSKKHYEENKSVYKDNRRKLRRRNGEFIEDSKKDKCCIKCGETDYRCLVFHHRKGEDKVCNINRMRNRCFSLGRIQKEIDKCDVMCANCHMILHYNEQNVVG